MAQTRWTPAASRAEAVPKTLRKKVGGDEGLLEFAGLCRSWGLTRAEGMTYAAGIWAAGDKLTHWVSPTVLARRLHEGRQGISGRLNAFIRYGLVARRPEIAHVARANGQGGGTATALRFPQYDDLQAAITAYVEAKRQHRPRPRTEDFTDAQRVSEKKVSPTRPDDFTDAPGAFSPTRRASLTPSSNSKGTETTTTRGDEPELPDEATTDPKADAASRLREAIQATGRTVRRQEISMLLVDQDGEPRDIDQLLRAVPVAAKIEDKRAPEFRKARFWRAIVDVYDNGGGRAEETVDERIARLLDGGADPAADARTERIMRQFDEADARDKADAQDEPGDLGGFPRLRKAE